MSSPRPIVILGPTAGGKSDLAADLAQHLPGPGRVIGADSMQVYRHLDAGTAKPPQHLRDRVPHEMIDIVEPTDRFTVHDWLRLTQQHIDDTRAAGGTPVVVGGTNLYLKALLEGLFDGPGQDEAFRKSLTPFTPQQLHEQLQRIDPDAAGRIAPADRQRLTRALEVFHLTGKPISELQTQWREAGSGQWGVGNGEDHDNDNPHCPTPTAHSLRLLGLRWPVELINPRINLRVKAMFTPEKVDPQLAADVCINGESLPDEVRRLHDQQKLGPQAREALGYKQVIAALFPADYPDLADPKIKTLDDAFERTKILTRRFAKQQRTWLKRFPNVHWIDMPCDDPLAEALAIAAANTP